MTRRTRGTLQESEALLTDSSPILISLICLDLPLSSAGAADGPGVRAVWSSRLYQIFCGG